MVQEWDFWVQSLLLPNGEGGAGYCAAWAELVHQKPAAQPLTAFRRGCAWQHCYHEKAIS